METKCCNCDELGDVCTNTENVWICWDCFYELPVIEPTEYWETRSWENPRNYVEEDELPF